jgi:hypothetical protein
MTDDKRNRMFDSEAPVNPSPRTTIVGGRPPDAKADLPPVPTGLQQLLRLAAVDASFRAELVARRGAFAATAGIPLTAHERAILDAVPAEQLTGMAESLPAPDADRREFLRQTARAAVVALGGAVLAGSNLACPTRGSRPDIPPEPPLEVPLQTAGIAPDVPPPRPAPKVPPPPTGHAPDVPPPRPVHRDMDVDGGAEPDVPSPRPARREMETEGGIAPGEPVERPEERETTDGISPDVPPPRPDRRVTGPKGGINPDLVKKRTKIK